jgi:hypothetical protein
MHRFLTSFLNIKSSMKSVASQLESNESISLIPRFVIPQINGFGDSQIQIKEPLIKRIPSSRLPQPAIASDQLNMVGVTPKKTQQIRNILNTSQFKNAHPFREQCHILAGHLRSDHVHTEFSDKEIANILGVPNGESVRKQTHISISDPNPEGRPPLINKETRSYMEKTIVLRSRIRNPV